MLCPTTGSQSSYFVTSVFLLPYFAIQPEGKIPPYMTYWNQEDIHSYFRVTNLPPLTEFTACFYFEPSDNDPIDALRSDGRGRAQHLISIASSSKIYIHRH